ncbi:MAG TPA: gamma-glutamyltransferase [Thermoanaerobaculia bacterium]|nr:gamma-glutamyltransferase [Thermoanaerobaculia bacterium]
MSPSRLAPAALALLLAAAPAAGIRGAVAADEADAVAAGDALLAAGGNAVDAAVATALALAVVHPEAGNLGGGGFAVVRCDGRLFALDFRETAPSGAHPALYLDAAGEPRPGASTEGPLAAGVPGSPHGYFELHRRCGRRPWAEVVAPAERLARDGFLLSERSAASLARHAGRLARFPESAATWLPGGSPPAAGTRIRLPALARTLAAYARQGPEALTTGAVAGAIAAAAARHAGILDAADLAAYRPVWREPLRTTAFGWELAGMGLPPYGGTIVAQTLALAERLGWAAAAGDGAGRAHLLAEIWRRAFADRTLLGDPHTAFAAPAELLAPGWLARRAAEIDARRATLSAAVAPYPGGVGREPADTTHLAVVDAEGNAAALTTTINDLFGCALFVPEAGIFLNNEMDDFATAPGRPNLYGLVQGEANRVLPGRRMLSSMSPTLAWRGSEVLAVGGRGGSRIPTATAQVLLFLLAEGESTAAAVARPRLHHQWLPDRLEAEAGALAEPERLELERRGHAVVPPPASAKVNLARRLAGDALEAAGDPRGPGAATPPASPAPVP